MDNEPRPDIPTAAWIVFICGSACGLVTGGLWVLDLVLR